MKVVKFKNPGGVKFVTELKPKEMNSNFKSNTATLKNDLGIVTDSRVIIHNGKNSSVIALDNIKKINLIRKRKLNANLMFMLLAGFAASILYYNMPLSLVSKLLLSSLLLVAMSFAVFTKFYLYQLVINLKNDESFTVKATAFRKAQLKKFYHSLRKKLRNE